MNHDNSVFYRKDVSRISVDMRKDREDKILYWEFEDDDTKSIVRRYIYNDRKTILNRTWKY